MSDQPEFLAMEEKIVYDFDELREENDYPVREICTRIQAIIEPCQPLLFLNTLSILR